MTSKPISEKSDETTLERQVREAQRMMETKVKITKQIYKAIDSHHRRERWAGLQLIKLIKEKYGLAKAEKIQ